ncbi:ATP-binding protein [Granulosicoccaceae sp. 1_MG-2023]|nr:ATP-binding protein [Granulosicoccaceae sp. 1_MG-2023]
MVPYLLTIIVDLVVALLALSNHRHPAARALAYFVFSLAVFQTELFLLKTISDEAQLTPYFHITRIGMFMLPAFFALLTWRVCRPDSALFKRWIVVPLFAVDGTISLLNNTILPSQLQRDQNGFLPQVDGLYMAFAVSLIYAMTASVIFAAWRYRRCVYRERLRLKWLLFTLGIGVLTAATSVLVFLISHDTYMQSTLSAVGNAVFLGVLLYAVVNHNLADTGSVISNLLVHGFAAGTMISIYYAITHLLSTHAGLQASEGARTFVQMLLFLVLLESYNSLIRFLNPGARKLLLNAPYDVDSVSQAAMRSLKRCVSSEDLTATLDEILLNTMKLKHYSMWIADEDLSAGSTLLLRSTRDSGKSLLIPEPVRGELHVPPEQAVLLADEVSPALAALLKENEAIACCPIHINNKLTGMLLVGKSRFYDIGDYYRYDDIRILINLTRELSPTLARINLTIAVQHDLDNARKTLSLIDLMNHYHHEIKAPLAIIDGILSNDLYPADKQRDIILRQVERGTELISLMGDVLRGERKRETRRIELLPLLKQCVGLFQRDINHIEYHSDEVVPVLGDKSDLSILFINLLKNAVESRRPGEPLSLSVRISGQEDGVQLRIRDNASGIAPEDLKNLWRGGFTTKPGGQGIGLQAVARIAREHGADIKVDSELGAGTTFTLLFPRSGPVGLVAEEALQAGRRPPANKG